jgi:hypothetical protein
MLVFVLAISSARIPIMTQVAGFPPYSSGTLRLRKPKSPIFFRIFLGI